MNGSRSSTPRHGERSSLEALNRTIEGLEARIEGLMAGATRGRAAPVAEAHAFDRHLPVAPPQAMRTQVRDPLTEIRERQRILEASRERVSRPDRQYYEERHEEAAPAPRRDVRAPETYASSQRAMPSRHDLPRQADQRAAGPSQLRRDVLRSAIPPLRPAPAQSQADHDAREIAEALVSLRQELKQDIAEGMSRELAAVRGEIRAIKTVAEDQRLAEDLKAELARLSDSIEHLGSRQEPEVQGLRAELEDLRSVMDSLAREDSIRQIGDRWQGIETRMQQFEASDLRDEVVALAYRMDEVKTQLGAMSDNPAVRALEQKLVSVASAMEQLVSHMQPTDTVIIEQFATLDERLDEISRAIAAGSRAAAAATVDHSFLQRIDGRIGTLAEQIDVIGQSVQTQGQPDEALAVRIEALTARIEELTEEQAALRLEERLEQLSLILDRANNTDQHDELTGYLSDISHRIEGLEQGTVNDGLAERLDYLAARIDGISQASGQEQPAFDRIEDQLSTIAARLDEAATAPRSDDSALRSLEEQIAHLSILIAQPQQSANGLPADFEDRMAAIEGYMATNDEYIIEAARQAAEAVVDAYSRNTAAGAPVAVGDLAALTALAEDLRHLEDLTRGSEERTHQSVEALHGTLVQIADRLDMMESRLLPYPQAESAGEPDHQPTMPKAAPLSVQAENRFQDEDMLRAEDLGLAVETQEKASKAGLLSGLSRRLLPGAKAEQPQPERSVVDPAPSIDPSEAIAARHENDLLEPGSGTPDVKKILERVRASQAAGAFDHGRTSETERADYIAAARRAAKAAADEADPAQERGAAKTSGRSAKSASSNGLWARLSGHRRPILMAVGAVLLALAAVPVANRFMTGEETATATAQLATPASQPSPVEASAPVDQAAAENLSGESAAAGMQEASAEASVRQARPTAAGEPQPADTRPDPIEAAISTSAMREQVNSDRIIPAVQEQAPAAIAIPAGIQPKSLADAAAAGDPNALFEIGARFTEGRGVKSDLSEAANWYKLAADRGLAPAQYRLANLFEKGTGVSRDFDRAVTYYKQAAEAGNASAMHNLAVLHASGALGQPDYTAAVNWFSKAAEHGVTDSQFNLAILYARGNGARQSLEESYKWFAVAAKEGDRDAAQKRDEVANAMRKDQLETARAAAESWKVQPLDPKANSVNLPEDWVSDTKQTTASVDMNKAIRNIQAILNKNGFDAGSPDGKIGAKTVAAIKSFQTSAGQEPTGKINDALVKELLARNK